MPSLRQHPMRVGRVWRVHHRELAARQRHRGPQNLGVALYQLYHYLKHGALAKEPTLQFPVCIRTHLTLITTQSRARPVAVPSEAAISSSSADLIVSDSDVNAFR
ncbi:hypothetical protein GN958_ATG16222 [Phytophthora infestans]|uniref:Uncharacterized protein n=1 Tax=Phytophthora infestans TaxID=4787 RepID=A0A8S9U5B0_PHYIN|nr:hypothetical protein GN958_ATG16222 [Phytophthora infestans]